MRRIAISQVVRMGNLAVSRLAMVCLFVLSFSPFIQRHRSQAAFSSGRIGIGMTVH
jgi:hypothetical protein